MPMAPSEVRPRAPGGRLLALLAFVAVLTVLHLGRDILMPFALAVLISFALAWPVTRLERWGLPRGVSVALVMALVLAAVGAGGWVVAHQMQNVLGELPEHRLAITAKVTALTERIAAFKSMGDSLVASPSPAPVIAPPVTPVIGEPGASPDTGSEGWSGG